MDDLYTRFDSTFFEKTRLSILTIVYRKGVASYTFLKRQLAQTDGAIYTHLEKLVQAGYLGKKREIAGGVARTSYFMTRSGKKAFQEYLSFLEMMLRPATNGGGSE